MIRRLRAACLVLLRQFLVLALACSPLAQPMALAAAGEETAPAAMQGCPHHAAMHVSGADHNKPGECPCKKGSPCHCAMTAALTTAIAATWTRTGSEHPVSVPRLALSVLPAPEPPPPRA
ncbi:hypothetical protein EZJ19_09250 [Parasulfuritortus cantonensis]|uniref:CopL family metal-binding regulatory protein n=1 Tax=Parasulfuritortus cantonensis TaxID=2528202 RepID=A0A4R1BCN6_9PROT|nr:hypothetical protein [Parasulfuritortus cantonensis]TCJ14757.1 hypothetical protein EZJ19_09250 [Parasulfuritortus cantonensis]